MDSFVADLSKVILYDPQRPDHNPWCILQYLVDDPQLDAVQYPYDLCLRAVDSLPNGELFADDTQWYACALPQLYVDVVHLTLAPDEFVMWNDENENGGWRRMTGDVWLPLFKYQTTFCVISNARSCIRMEAYAFGFHVLDYVSKR